jgi:hypothetical protein
MKHLTTNTLMIFAALAGSAALRAQDSVDVPLPRVCDYARSRTIQVKLPTGETVEGVCFSTTVDEMQVQTKNGIVKIARAQLSRVSVVEVPRRQHLARLGKHVKQGLDGSVKMIPTEMGLAGVVGVPLTLAYGAVAAPFCLLGDILGYSKNIQVRVIQVRIR